MGVDFIDCDECGDIFNDCGDYAVCQTCGLYLCSECKKKRKIEQMADLRTLTDEDNTGWTQCPFCAHEIVKDDVLLVWALRELSVTKEAYTAKVTKSFNLALDSPPVGE